MLTLNMNMTTPKTLWLLFKNKPTILWAQLCLQAHLRAPTGYGCAPCVLGKVDNVSLFRKEIVYLPRMSIHVEGLVLVNMIFLSHKTFHSIPSLMMAWGTKSHDVYINLCATYLFLVSLQHSCQYGINAL